MLRWRTWLWRKFALRASGVVSKDGCRKTAVPGTRGIGGEAASISATKSVSGPSTASRRCVITTRPRRQVASSVATAAAISRAIQPPWGILVTLAANRVTSMPRKSAPNTTERQGRHFQSQCVTARNRIVLTMKVPVTAMP